MDDYSIRAHVYFDRTNLRSRILGSPVQTVTRIFPKEKLQTASSTRSLYPPLSFPSHMEFRMYMSRREYVCVCVCTWVCICDSMGGADRMIFRVRQSGSRGQWIPRVSLPCTSEISFSRLIPHPHLRKFPWFSLTSNGDTVGCTLCATVWPHEFEMRSPSKVVGHTAPIPDGAVFSLQDRPSFKFQMRDEHQRDFLPSRERCVTLKGTEIYLNLIFYSKLILLLHYYYLYRYVNDSKFKMQNLI